MERDRLHILVVTRGQFRHKAHQDISSLMTILTTMMNDLFHQILTIQGHRSCLHQSYCWINKRRSSQTHCQDDQHHHHGHHFEVHHDDWFHGVCNIIILICDHLDHQDDHHLHCKHMISITIYIVKMIVITILKLHRDDWFPGVVTELARQLEEALQCTEDCTKHCNALKIVPNIAHSSLY